MPDHATLHVQSQQSTSIRVIDLRGGTIRIGRAAFCDVRIPDPAIAEEECRLAQRGGVWQLVPSPRSTAVWIDGRRLDRPCVLSLGDAFRVGEHRLILQTAGIAPVWSTEAEESEVVVESVPQPAAVPVAVSAAAVTAPPRSRVERRERPVDPERWNRSVEERRKWESRFRAVEAKIKAGASAPVDPPSIEPRTTHRHPLPRRTEQPAPPRPELRSNLRSDRTALVDRPQVDLPSTDRRSAFTADYRPAQARRVERQSRVRLEPLDRAPVPQIDLPTEKPARRPERVIRGIVVESPVEAPAVVATVEALPLPVPPVVEPEPVVEAAPVDAVIVSLPEPVVEVVPEVVAASVVEPVVETEAPAPDTLIHAFDEIDEDDFTQAAEALPHAIKLGSARQVERTMPQEEPVAAPCLEPAPAAEAFPFVPPAASTAAWLLEFLRAPAAAPVDLPVMPADSAGSAAGVTVEESVEPIPASASVSVEIEPEPEPAAAATSEPEAPAQLAASHASADPNTLIVNDTAFPAAESPVWAAPREASLSDAARPIPLFGDHIRTDAGFDALVTSVGPFANAAGGPSPRELPTVSDILAAQGRRDRETAGAASARPQPARKAVAVDVSQMPTIPMPPQSWSLPIWLGWLPAATVAAGVGFVGCAASWLWARDAFNAGVVASRLMAGTEKVKPLPEGVIPGRTNWWATSAGHLVEWAAYLDRYATDASQSEEARALLNRAMEASPLQATARYAAAHPLPDDKEPPTLVRSLSQTRDVVALSWSGRRLLASGKKDAALRAYALALEMAAHADPARSGSPLFLDDAQTKRYALPGEDLIATIVRDLASAPEVTYKEWSAIVPRQTIVPVVVARVLRQQMSPDAPASLDVALQVVDEAPVGRPAEAALLVAAQAEALAMKEKWSEAQERYREAIEQMPLDVIRRSWWMNVADLALRLNEETTRRNALDLAKGLDTKDEITQRAVEAQRDSGMVARRDNDLKRTGGPAPRR